MKLICQVTGREYGEDIWPVGQSCDCLNCLVTQRDELLDLLENALPYVTPATSAHEEIAQTIFSTRGKDCRCGYCRFAKRLSEPPTIKRFKLSDRDRILDLIAQDISNMSDAEFEERCRTSLGWFDK